MTVSKKITGGVVLVDDLDAVLISGGVYRHKATYSQYVSIKIDGRWKRLARVIMGEPEGLVVDHINGDPFDNRRANLRICTVRENNWNRRRRVGGSSDFKGVSKAGSRWKATIWPRGQQRHLGTFDTPEAAARSYDRAAREEYGEFACLNFPDQSTGDVRSARLHAPEVRNV